MVIIITGSKGIGKSTVCRKLVEIARDQGLSCSGILTYKATDKSIIVEDIQRGEKETLASTHNVYHGPRTPKYSFNPKGINFGVQAIDAGITTAILIVDEIGPLELRGEGFVNTFELIKDCKAKVCILVIRKELVSAFLPQLPAIPFIFETTIDNRDKLPRKIEALLSLAERRSSNLVKPRDILQE